MLNLPCLRREEIDRELPFALTLGVALPKGDRQKWLIEKAVELGVGRLVPLKTHRAVAQPVQQALDRLASHGDRSLEAMRTKSTDGNRRAARLVRLHRRNAASILSPPGSSDMDRIQPL